MSYRRKTSVEEIFAADVAERLTGSRQYRKGDGYRVYPNLTTGGSLRNPSQLRLTFFYGRGAAEKRCDITIPYDTGADMEWAQTQIDTIAVMARLGVTGELSR